MKQEKIKGYKVMNPDMTCRDFQFKVRKTAYVHKGQISMCEAGFHFCKELGDCYKYYGFDKKNVVCEVEAVGKVIEGDDKIVTDKLKIIRVIELEEILELLNFFTSSNSGSDNRGSSNRGSSNRGSYNSGSYNRGSSNRGSYNRGSYNRGSYNSGSDNRGSDNRGSSNSGIYNFASNCVGVFNYNSFLGKKDKCYCFNARTELSLMQFYRKYLIILKEIRSYDFENVDKLPNFTQSKWNLISKYL